MVSRPVAAITATGGRIGLGILSIIFTTRPRVHLGIIYLAPRRQVYNPQVDSWWTLGDWVGHQGEDLAVWKITCPFCMECGNFEEAFHAEKKKPNSRKKLNFSTLRCGNCAGYVMVLWSVSTFRGLHGFEVLPWPLKLDKHPEHWPENVGRFWLQAKRNIIGENWEAAVGMARSTLQVALRDKGAEGKNLQAEINDFAMKGELPPLMKDWADNVRALGNESLHPNPGGKPTDPQDARDIVQFLDFFLEYFYTLPHRIRAYRQRGEVQGDGA